jgi:TolB-like protein/class 3 adenylate cyclase/Flp pilus assembly protein TadD
MTQSRQLAAIMFTDIVGYTALMGNDEQKAFDLLVKNRELQKPIIEQFNGQWIKELGDGVMASFHTISDAVYAAIKIQDGCNAAKDFQLRIGIHLGEVVFENEDIFGDGVNIAARIQAIADPGSIYISESVHNNVSNKKDIDSKFIKVVSLKNVKDPVRVYVVASAKEANPVVKESINGEPKRSSLKSIAVLPFVNMSNDPEQEYFSDGMSEEILNSLAHLKDLEVAGRTSSFYFKGKNLDIREIGEKLNVRTVMEGSVRKQGNKLRITVQLINVENGFHFWSEKYDREIDDVFAIQDEIAMKITEKLKVTLLEDEKAVIVTNPTDDHEAYDLYLKGRFYFNKRGLNIFKGLEYFHQAATKDPDFVLAYTGIADAYSILGFYSIIPSQEAMPKARLNAEKALALDPDNVEAYTTLAFINAIYDWNWEEAKKKFQTAFAINPNYAPAHFWYSYYLVFLEGNFDEAIKLSKKAAEQLEPFVSISHHVLSVVNITAGNYDQAIASSKKAIELEPATFPGYRTLGISLMKLGRYDESIEAFNKSALFSARHPWILVELSCLYAMTGQIEEARKLMDELIQRSQAGYIPGLYVTAYHLKDYDKAIEYLEEAIANRDGSLISMKNWPFTQFVKTDPRFQPYLKRMNFPE